MFDFDRSHLHCHNFFFAWDGKLTIFFMDLTRSLDIIKNRGHWAFFQVMWVYFNFHASIFGYPNPCKLIICISYSCICRSGREKETRLFLLLIETNRQFHFLFRPFVSNGVMIQTTYHRKNKNTIPFRPHIICYKMLQTFLPHVNIRQAKICHMQTLRYAQHICVVAIVGTVLKWDKWTSAANRNQRRRYGASVHLRRRGCGTN